MFQEFSVKGGAALGREHLPQIREAMHAQGLDWFMVPHEDSYQNEYLPDAFERLAYATGFTGSAGAAILGLEKAALFVDGRYTVQGRAQTDPTLFEQVDFVAGAQTNWLSRNIQKGEVVGYDPELHTLPSVKALTKAVERAGATLQAVNANPIDAVWTDQPALRDAPVTPHADNLAGVSHKEKRHAIAGDLQGRGIDAAVLTSPVSVAWLLNLRGGDVAHTPAPLGRVVINQDGRATLFMKPGKLTGEAQSALGNDVAVRDEGEFWDALGEYENRTVLVDANGSPAKVAQLLEQAGAQIVMGEDPCALPRACKNATEVDGARTAHQRDGVAVTRFLHWLATQGQSGEVDEITAAQKLESIRKESDLLRDISFETISAAGPNSALPHYRVNEESNRILAKGSLYLVDSGGQYPDGTTDITRTIAIGEPTAEMAERNTLVLKGHIALTMIRFPPGTTGSALDGFARHHLWMAGLDFDHGTGHGVGSYLGVHEGPQRISKAPNDVALKPGMIVSNEPGYYREGDYGIRIENLQVVTPPAPIPGGERDMLGFETLTLAPLAKELIVTSMLTHAERQWVDDYHARVLSEIGPHLPSEAERQWLDDACKPLV
jgi:Xaa-Pro aminopeptidase